MTLRALHQHPRRRRAALAGLLLWALTAMAGAGCASRRSSGPGDEGLDLDAPAVEPWRARQLRPAELRHRGPAPAPAPTLGLGPSQERVRYPAAARDGDHSLLAILAAPRRAPQTPASLAERAPAVLLLHDGFALRDEHLSWAAPFVDAGFLVMLPTFRGENGNDGAFELLAGEVDDARAAARWLASQPDVDVDRLYVFGHGTGGALAALLALDPELPFRRIAASSGATTVATFARWQRADERTVPFDVANAAECQRRALLPNAHELARPLLLFVGEDDALGGRDARLVQERAPDRVELVMVPGDERTAVAAALQRFLQQVVADAGLAPVAATWRPAASSRSAP